MMFPEAREAAELRAAEPRVWDEDFDIVRARHDNRAAALAQMPADDSLEIEDIDASGVRCRSYRTTDAGLGVLVLVHGGGFVLHDIDVYDDVARRLAGLLTRPVLSVDYRRSPEHPFPAALHDIDTVLQWLEREGAAHRLGGSVAVAGDGAGANLALSSALRNSGRLSCVALISPMVDASRRFDTQRTENAGLDARTIAWFWTQYGGGDRHAAENPDFSPLWSAELWTLPPTLIITAEHDPLRGEGEHLARLSAEQGVRVVGVRYLGQINDFARQIPHFAAAGPAIAQVAAFVNEHS